MKLAAAAGELATAVVFVILGSGALWQSLAMPGSGGGVLGPGFMPTVLSILLIVVGLGLTARVVVRRRDGLAFVDVGHRNIVVAVAALFGLVFLFERLGYLVTSALFLFVLLRAYSPLGWGKSAIAAVVGAAASYYFFHGLLDVVLPRGTLLDALLPGGF